MMDNNGRMPDPEPMYQLDIIGLHNDTSWTFDEEPELEFYCPETTDSEGTVVFSGMLLRFRGEFTARYPNGGKIQNAIPQKVEGSIVIDNALTYMVYRVVTNAEMELLRRQG